MISLLSFFFMSVLLVSSRPSQSPSLLISGSSSWPQRAPALLLAFAAENIQNVLLALKSRFALVKTFELNL